MGKLSGTALSTFNTFSLNRQRVSNILSAPKLKARDKRVAVYNYILQEEVLSGTQFILTMPDETPYVRIGILKCIVQLPKHGRGADTWFAYAYQRYGMNERDEITKFVYDCLRSHIIMQGDLVEMRRFACFDRKSCTLYLSSYDGNAYQIDGNEVLIVPNGENVYFADDDGGRPCVVDVGDHGILLDTLTNLSYAEDTPGGITVDQQKKLLTIYLFMLSFADLMPTKPILLLEGAPGAGKSSAAQFMQLVLMGFKKPMILQKNKEEDFGVILLRSPLAVFDNTDSYIEWVPDAICAYATSGIWTKRKLYTESEEVTIRPHSFIAVASKNPASFRREDVADRCIFIRLQRRPPGEFIRQDKIETDILLKRSQLLGEYMFYLNKIVDKIREGALDKEREGAGTSRMADFQAFAYLVGEVFEWPEGEIISLMDALQRERDAFINEEDCLADLLLTWVKHVTNGKWNAGRLITLQQLFQELSMIAGVQNVQFYKSSKTLAQKLRSPHIETDFIVQTAHDPAHRNSRAYQIWARTATGLPASTTSKGLSLVEDSESSEVEINTADPSTPEDDEPTGSDS